MCVCFFSVFSSLCVCLCVRFSCVYFSVFVSVCVCVFLRVYFFVSCSVHVFLLFVFSHKFSVCVDVLPLCFVSVCVCIFSVCTFSVLFF